MEVVARRYSSTECWDPSGLEGVYQASVGRWDAGKRWMWESMIGVGIVVGVVFSFLSLFVFVFRVLVRGRAGDLPENAGLSECLGWIMGGEIIERKENLQS